MKPARDTGAGFCAEGLCAGRPARTEFSREHVLNSRSPVFFLLFTGARPRRRVPSGMRGGRRNRRQARLQLRAHSCAIEVAPDQHEPVADRAGAVERIEGKVRADQVKHVALIARVHPEQHFSPKDIVRERLQKA